MFYDKFTDSIIEVFVVRKKKSFFSLIIQSVFCIMLCPPFWFYLKKNLVKWQFLCIRINNSFLFVSFVYNLFTRFLNVSFHVDGYSINQFSLCCCCCYFFTPTLYIEFQYFSHFTCGCMYNINLVVLFINLKLISFFVLNFCFVSFV